MAPFPAHCPVSRMQFRRYGLNEQGRTVEQFTRSNACEQ